MNKLHFRIKTFSDGDCFIAFRDSRKNREEDSKNAELFYSNGINQLMTNNGGYYQNEQHTNSLEFKVLKRILKL